MITAPRFSFDADRHVYELDGVVIPSVTQLIEKGGLVNGSAYFTEESLRRGTAVHQACMDWELGTLDLLKYESPYRGYVLAYVAAFTALKPTWDEIEVADYHPDYRFGGRTDRIGLCLERDSVGEIKTAAKASHHRIQTALQAMLRAHRRKVDPRSVQRLCIYLEHTGKFSVELHEDDRDFDQAHELLRRFAC